MTTQKNLQISEIYKSVQGESSFTGWPCVFVRLTGCPLRCRWCDTTYSFQGGTLLSLEEILNQVKAFNIPLVELTGGEPLAQESTPDLLNLLVKNQFRILIETSGAQSIAQIPKEVHIIMDVKCPDSKMSDMNLWSNLELLKPTDEIKFVIASRDDFLWSLQIIKEFRLENRFPLLFSPAWGLVKPDLLVSWILEQPINVRLNLQIHKYIWHPRKKGV